MRVKVIPLRELTVHPDHPRPTAHVDSLSGLAESLRMLGMLQPIHVRPLAPNKRRGVARYEVLAGLRRRFAAERLGWGEVPCVVHKCCTDSAAVSIMCAEQLHRVGWSHEQRTGVETAACVAAKAS